MSSIPSFAEPAIGKVPLNLSANPPLGADRNTGDAPFRVVHRLKKAEQVFGAFQADPDPYTCVRTIHFGSGVSAPANGEVDKMQIPTMKATVIAEILTIDMS